MKGKEYLYIHG